MLFAVIGFSTTAFSLTLEDTFNATFKIDSVTVGKSESTINLSSPSTGQYGKVWLTYDLNLDNPATPNQGSFTGRAVAIDGDGNRNSATRQGVWERKGKMMHFKSLDDVSDGNQFLCITSVNLIDDSLEMKFYSVK